MTEAAKSYITTVRGVISYNRNMARASEIRRETDIITRALTEALARAVAEIDGAITAPITTTITTIAEPSLF